MTKRWNDHKNRNLGDVSVKNVILFSPTLRLSTSTRWAHPTWCGDERKPGATSYRHLSWTEKKIPKRLRAAARAMRSSRPAELEARYKMAALILPGECWEWESSSVESMRRPQSISFLAFSSSQQAGPLPTGGRTEQGGAALPSCPPSPACRTQGTTHCCSNQSAKGSGGATASPPSAGRGRGAWRGRKELGGSIPRLH
jgi:hypothetical protein